MRKRFRETVVLLLLSTHCLVVFQTEQLCESLYDSVSFAKSNCKVYLTKRAQICLRFGNYGVTTVSAMPNNDVYLCIFNFFNLTFQINLSDHEITELFELFARCSRCTCTLCSLRKVISNKRLLIDVLLSLFHFVRVLQ